MTPRRPLSAQAGFTLVEIMIALLIGLVAVVVIMQTYAVSEGFKRTSTSGSDATTNGGIALYMLERDIRMAGYGLNGLSSNCTSIAVYNAAAAATISVPVWPAIQINPAGVAAGDANTDVLLVAYGNSDDFAIPVKASQAGGQTSDYAVTSNYSAIRNGDLLVAYNVGSTCILTEVTAAPKNSSGSCNVANSSYYSATHGTAAYRNFYQNCAQVAPKFNPGGGVTDPASGGVVAPLAPAGTTGYVFDLGGSPQIKAYAVRGGNLTVCDLLQQNCSVAANFATVMNDVVSLRVMFGQDNLPAGAPDGQIDTWSRAAGNTMAVALQVTARSALKEKPSAGGATCDTTATASRPDKAQDWFGPALATDGTGAAAQIDLSTVSADWQCYRYKLFQTTTPLRNVIWTP